MGEVGVALAGTGVVDGLTGGVRVAVVVVAFVGDAEGEGSNVGEGVLDDVTVAGAGVSVGRRGVELIMSDAGSGRGVAV